jgi:hypothetical protein
MLQDNLTHAPIVNRQAYLAILAVAVVLGTLGYFYDKIIIFSIIFAIYNLFNMWAVWVVNQHLTETFDISKSNPTIEESSKMRIAILEEYYLRRPQIPRIVTIMFFSMTSIIFGILGALSNSPHATYFLYGAYVIMILNISLSELVIWFWRQTRDERIKGI